MYLGWVGHPLPTVTRLGASANLLSSMQTPWMHISQIQTPTDAIPPPPRYADLPWMQTPLPRADPSLHADTPPQCRPTPGPVICDACWEANPHPSQWTEGMTDACENITFSQTSFAGGNNTSAYYFVDGIPLLSIFMCFVDISKPFESQLFLTA